MNVLPVLLDLSPSIKTDLPAPGGGSSVGGFARILDTALSGPVTAPGSSDYSASSPSLPSTPYEPPTKLAGGKDAATTEPRREDAASVQKPATTTAPPAHGDKRDATPAADRSSRKTANSDRHVKEKASSSGAGKTVKPKPTSPSKDAAKAAAQRAAHEKAAAKGHHDQKGTAAGKARLSPFPGAIVLGSTKKDLQSVLDKAVERAAQAAKQAAKAQSDPLPRGGAKGLPVAEASRKTPAGKEVRGKEAQTTEKKTKATHPAAAKGIELAAELQPGAGLFAVGGGTAQQSAAANATPPGPSGQAGHPSGAPTPSQNPAGAVPALTVIDLRHTAQNGGSQADPQGGHDQSGQAAAIRLFQLAEGGTNSTSFPGGQAAAVRAGGAPLPSQAFSALTDHIVKQTGILLKDNNSGEIRLVLKPEHLGQVRIKIDMVNNSLTGKIFVQNHEALRLVQQNLDGLYRALRDSGFTASQLNVSVGGREGREREKAHSSPLPLLRAVEGVRGFDSQTPAMEALGGVHSLVNLVI